LTGEILNTCVVEDHAFAVAGELFSPRQTLELLLLIGYFRMICSLMTALDVEAEPPFWSEDPGFGRRWCARPNAALRT